MLNKLNNNINHYFHKFTKYYYLFLIISIFNALLEFISLIALIIIMQILLNNLSPSFELSLLSHFLLLFDQKQLLFISIFFLLFKNFFFIFYFRIYSAFLTKVFLNYIEKYYYSLIDIKYLDLIKLKTSKILNHIPRNIESIFSKYFFPLCYIFSDILTILIIIIYLIYLYSFELTLVFLPFLILFLISYSIIKNLIGKASKIRLKKYQEIISLVRMSLEFGEYIRLSKLKGLSKIFLEKNLSGLHKPFRDIYFFNNFTRSFYEISAILFMVVFTLVVYKLSPSLEIINTIGIVSLSLIRFLPNLARLNALLYSLKGVSADIDDVKDQLKFLIDLKKNKNIKIHNIIDKKEGIKKIHLNSISFRYEKDKDIFNNFSFTFEEGKNYVLYGSSGTGKSSLGLILSGLLDLNGGKILFYNFNSSKAEEIINYLPQQNYIMSASIIENISLEKNISKINLEKMNESLVFANLQETIKKEDLSNEMFDYGNNLSGGQNRRLVLARSFYNMKEINIFDEPTSNLDEKNSEIIINNIAKSSHQRINIIFTHDNNFIRNIKYNVINIDDVR